MKRVELIILTIVVAVVALIQMQMVSCALNNGVCGIDPKIKCKDNEDGSGPGFSLGCSSPSTNPLVNAALHVNNFAFLAAEGFWRAGCWCENCNNTAPACPAWLTCPPGVPENLVILGYNVENWFANNPCHCMCKSGECPGFTVPVHN